MQHSAGNRGDSGRARVRRAGRVFGHASFYRNRNRTGATFSVAASERTVWEDGCMPGSVWCLYRDAGTSGA